MLSFTFPLTLVTSNGKEPTAMLKYYMTRLPQSPITLAGWPEIDRIRHQLDQVFTELTQDQPIRIPAIELSHTDEAIVLTAELPGITANDLAIEVTRNQVSLKGESRSSLTQAAQVYHSERRTGSFQRVISLPIAIDHTIATAEFHDGILTLTLPKLQEVKSTAVKVTVPTPHDPVGESIAPTAAKTADPNPGDAWQ
jgi:HSP20 family protein